MSVNDLKELITELESEWDTISRKQRLQAESEEGIDLYPQHQESIDTIQAALLNTDQETKSRIAQVPMGQWVAYLAVITSQRFVATLWALNEHIPGFVDRCIGFCEVSDKEISQFVIRRLARIVKRSILEEVISPSNLSKYVFSN